MCKGILFTMQPQFSRSWAIIKVDILHYLSCWLNESHHLCSGSTQYSFVCIGLRVCATFQSFNGKPNRIPRPHYKLLPKLSYLIYNHLRRMMACSCVCYFTFRQGGVKRSGGRRRAGGEEKNNATIFLATATSKLKKKKPPFLLEDCGRGSFCHHYYYHSGVWWPCWVWRRSNFSEFA